MKEMAKAVPDAASYAPVTILVDERDRWGERPPGTRIRVKRSSMFSKGRRWSTRSKESRR